jgi:hypothetical protein
MTAGVLLTRHVISLSTAAIVRFNGYRTGIQTIGLKPENTSTKNSHQQECYDESFGGEIHCQLIQ